MRLQSSPDESPAPAAAPPLGSVGEEVGRRLLDHRRVMLFGEVETKIANLVCAQLVVLDDADPGSEITMLINSPGGSVDDGFAIYDVMQTLRSPIATVGMGLVASMGQFLLCAGTPGRRAAHRHASILMHQPLGSASGFATDLAIHAEHFARTRKLMANLIARHTGQDYERVLADADRDRWFTADEALEYGMIDTILDRPTTHFA
jgi:ATP-dependent Clp protease protease subunit